MLLEALNEPRTLFSQQLDRPTLLDEAGAGEGDALSFHEKLGRSVWRYVVERRLEAATYLLHKHEALAVREVAERIGFSSRGHLSRALQNWHGTTATAIRKKSTLGDQDLVLAVDQVLAETLWETLANETDQEIRRRLVSAFEFESRAFQSLLGEKYLEVSRFKGRDPGIEVAELALQSIETSASVLGEEIYDLRAQAWSRIGNARRLALDIDAAEEAFEKAEKAWEMSREQKDRTIRAELLGHKAQLRATQRRFKEAMELLNELIAGCGLGDNSHYRARGLIQRAAVADYSGWAEVDTISDLKEALEILEICGGERRLTFGATLSLTFAHIQAKVYDRAELQLLKLEGMKEELAVDPLLAPQIDWLRGLIAFGRNDFRMAEHTLSKARSKYRQLGEKERMAVVSVDLSRVQLEQGNFADVLRLSSEALPFLECLKAEPEIMRAFHVFREALERQRLDAKILEQVRNALLQKQRLLKV